MGKYILKRILWMIPIIIGVVFLVFTILYFTPGEPAYNALGMQATPDAIEIWNQQHGLDRGFFARLFDYYKGLIQLDFGKSWLTNVPVAQEIVSRFPYTVLMGLVSLCISISVGIPTGILAATHQNSWIDRLMMAINMFLTSMPGFWFALMMVMFLAVQHDWLPVAGSETWKHYIIPCVSTGLGATAGIARQTRSSMLEVIRQDYVITARAKGQTEPKITKSHCLRNGMIPVMTVIGGHLAFIVGGSMVNEQVFAIPGLGVYMFNAILAKDIPIVLGCTVVMSVYFCFMMLLTDVLYTLIDPRLRTVMFNISSKKRKKEEKKA